MFRFCFLVVRLCSFVRSETIHIRLLSFYMMKQIFSWWVYT